MSPPTGTAPNAADRPGSRPSAREQQDDRVTLAAITGAHGIAGEVKLKLFTDDLSPYRSFNDGALTLASLRGNVARFDQIADRTAAEAARGNALTIPRAALPPLAEGEYYHADLIDLPVLTPAGDAVGRVVAVENFGAGDVLEIERPSGKTFMVPLRADAVPDWTAERLLLDPAFADG